MEALTINSETLFQEHWRRFFLSPQADVSAVRRISGALYWNDQLLWSLGVIPWGAWRLPFQAAVLRLLTEADKQRLVQRMEQFCEGETAAHLVRQIQAVTPRQSFFSNAILESLLERFSARYRSCLRQRESAYYACLFHWSWQYTYRNQEYQKLRSALEPFLQGAGSVSIVPCLPVSNLKEYQTITGRLETGNGLGQELFAVCNQAIDAIVEKFGYFPAWPIVDYTSEFILDRMLSGQFHYWERENPPPKIGHEGNFQLCSRDATQCTLEGRKTQTVSNGKRQLPLCSPDCLAAVQQEEQRLYRTALNEERGRIRAEPLHRMLGLWLWDHCREHATTPVEAMRALEERHFPETNPHWQPLECGTGKNLDWYDFRELTIARPTLYADYQDACRCIEAAKFLPRLRGVKKTRNSAKSKAESRR